MTREEPIRGDLRVRRTRKLIVDALVELTIEKGFAAVTVQDIVQRAGINRATFYRHYQDKIDLVNQYAEAVYQLPDHAPEPRAPTGKDAPPVLASGLARVLEHVRQNADFFRVMLGPHGDPTFAARIRQYMQKRIRGSMSAALLSDANLSNLFLSYVSSGAVAVLLWWLEQETPYSPEQMVDIVSQFIGADAATLRQVKS